MDYWSLCSGIEAVTCAWEPLGLRPQLFAETDSFCSAVLKERYPQVPNVGDIRKHDEWPIRPCQIIVGGTPCQSFSSAGKREGLSDPRGIITLHFFDLVEKRQPKWVLWEQVPRVLSSQGGIVFGEVLERLARGGYGYAWRVLDSRFFGLPQKRKRLFLVGCHKGEWRRAAQVLFDTEGSDGPFAEGGKEGTPLDASAHPARLRGPDCAGTLNTRPHSNEYNAYSLLVEDQLAGQDAIRCLTPEEYEALQGFPRGWTNIETDAGPASDYQRYKSVGNSMPVPVIAHLGEKLLKVERGEL